MIFVVNIYRYTYTVTVPITDPGVCTGAVTVLGGICQHQPTTVMGLLLAKRENFITTAEMERERERREGERERGKRERERGGGREREGERGRN